MKKEKLNAADETIPFAFKTKEVSDAQISKHWNAILEKIKELEGKGPDDDQSSNQSKSSKKQ